MNDQNKSVNKRIMIWVGSITAILTLIFGLQQFYTQLTSKIKDSENVDTLLQASQVRIDAKDYPQAWEALEQADQYNVMEDEVESAKVRVAMLWLQNISASQNSGSFTDQVKRVIPVLNRAAIKSEGEYLADIYAHMGWADYLRQRDGNFGLNPDKYYAKALDVDNDNAYANAMLGHWLLSNNRARKPEKGWQYLQVAVNTGNHLDYIRHLQFTALKNHHFSNIDFLKLLHDMRVNGEAIEDDVVAHILRANYLGTGFRRFEVAFRSGKPVKTSIALEDDLVLIEWLWQEYPHLVDRYQPYRPYIIAILTESIGDKTTAHNMYKELQAGLPDNSPSMYKMGKYMQTALERTEPDKV